MAEIMDNVDRNSVLFSLTDDTREMVDKARARELVDAALGGRDPASITKVRLSNKSYSPEAAGVISETLKEMTSVTEVDFSDIIAGRPKEEGLQVLAAVCGGVADRDRLSYLDLSENAMGPDGVEACRPAIEGKKELEALFMCNDGLSEAAMEAVRDILLSSTPTSLRRLHFFNNMSGDGGARALAEVLPHCPKLSDFRFSGTRARRLGSAVVVNALVKCPAVSAGLLERLDLADNTLGGDGAEALAEALSSQPALTHVNLRDCELEDDGSDAVAEVLSGTAPLLKELDFSGNELTSEGAESVALCAAGKPSLEYLGLEDNEIDTEGAKAVAKALASTPCIRKILLNSNEIGSSGALAVARSVRDKKHLQSLEINGNALSEDGLTRLRRILESAGKLDALGDMDDNDPDGDEDDEEEELDEEEEGVDKGDGEGAAKMTTPAPREDGEMDELSAALGAVKV